MKTETRRDLETALVEKCPKHREFKRLLRKWDSSFEASTCCGPPQSIRQHMTRILELRNGLIRSKCSAAPKACSCAIRDRNGQLR